MGAGRALSIVTANVTWQMSTYHCKFHMILPLDPRLQRDSHFMHTSHESSCLPCQSNIPLLLKIYGSSLPCQSNIPLLLRIYGSLPCQSYIPLLLRIYGSLPCQSNIPLLLRICDRRSLTFSLARVDFDCLSCNIWLNSELICDPALFYTQAQPIFFWIELISHFTLILITSYGSLCGNTGRSNIPPSILWKYGGVPKSRYDLRHPLAISHTNHILVLVLPFLKIDCRHTEIRDVPNKNDIYIWDRYFSQIVATYIKVSLSS